MAGQAAGTDHEIPDEVRALLERAEAAHAEAVRLVADLQGWRDEAVRQLAGMRAIGRAFRAPQRAIRYG